jgi:hypothetical protein
LRARGRTQGDAPTHDKKKSNRATFVMGITNVARPDLIQEKGERENLWVPVAIGIFTIVIAFFCDDHLH